MSRLTAAITLIAIPALLFALFQTVRFTLADSLARSGSLDSVTRAIQMSPDDARLYLQRAELNAPNAVQDLRRAASLNPSNAAPWIELGLKAEAAQDFQQAEQNLLEASRRDAGYSPRWSLANYYFRRQQWDKFWHWAQSGAALYHGDLKALYRLCLRADADPLFTMKRIVPPRPAAQREFLELLVEQKRWDHVEAAALTLLTHARVRDTDLVLYACEHFIQGGQPDPAIELWNGLAQRRLIPFQTLDLSAGRSLTNASFGVPFTAKGFDWRPSEIEGVTLQQIGSPAGLRFEFSGHQPASCTLLAQILPLLPGRRYRLRYEYQSGLSGPGCRWRVLNQLSNPLSKAESFTRGSFEVLVPAGQPLVTLELISRHEPGYVRPEGRLEIESVQLQLIP